MYEMHICYYVQVFSSRVLPFYAPLQTRKCIGKKTRIIAKTPNMSFHFQHNTYQGLDYVK